MKTSRNFSNPVLLRGSIFGKVFKLSCKKYLRFSFSNLINNRIFTSPYSMMFQKLMETSFDFKISNPKLLKFGLTVLC